MKRRAIFVHMRRGLSPPPGELIIAAWFERKFEGENSSMPQAVAMRAQRASQFNRRQHRAVKTKPMAVLACGKTVIEDARQVFRGNPNSSLCRRFGPEGPIILEKTVKSRCIL